MSGRDVTDLFPQVCINLSTSFWFVTWQGVDIVAQLKYMTNASLRIRSFGALNTKGHHDANFVVTGGNGGHRYVNLRYCYLSLHHDNSQFSEHPQILCSHIKILRCSLRNMKYTCAMFKFRRCAFTQHKIFGLDYTLGLVHLRDQLLDLLLLIISVSCHIMQDLGIPHTLLQFQDVIFPKQQLYGAMTSLISNMQYIPSSL